MALNDLFNSSPGCNLVEPTGDTQNQNFSCSVPANGGEDGYTEAAENPINDVALAEPAAGSNVGISQLEDQGAHNGPAGTTTAPINYGTSSRAAQSSDLKGLNFVAWAKGGISWFHFTKIGKVGTPSAAVTNLTLAQLTAIWNGTDTNWDQVGGSNAPIAVYVAGTGSGLETTWAKALGIAAVPPGVTDPSTHVINQDSDTKILANGDEKDAIYYYSVGYFNTFCPKGKCSGNKKYTAALGSIAGVAPSQTTILNNTFPVTNFLYNVYSNGENTNIPVASQATLNYASEDGFLCKSSTTTDIDPITGVAYRTEIDKAITGTGFFPLPSGPEGTVDTPAPLNTASGPYSGIGDLSTSNPTGFCLVTTTDANSGS